jgi:hypothetical protein
VSEQQPSEEELRAALEEQMKNITVEDVLLQTVVTLVNLAGRRLTAEGEKDIEQARLGIEAVRALLPLCPQDQVGPIKDALSQLQMLFARESGQAPGPGPGPGPRPEPEPEPEKKPESKIWTPPGT